MRLRVPTRPDGNIAVLDLVVSSYAGGISVSILDLVDHAGAIEVLISDRQANVMFVTLVMCAVGTALSHFRNRHSRRSRSRSTLTHW